ncbi:hypothetical protein GpartN1_g427.t1 [Galdieria partita]|uniref:peptidylprolyl isomerase n=1 Tax=Galdieria partita TaxID=83374 RepID=A0A9C7UMU9_9RHOD|nr:hypothetical protein GpartN1_g427.t1 [Galdieria partita]
MYCASGFCTSPLPLRLNKDIKFFQVLRRKSSERYHIKQYSGFQITPLFKGILRSDSRLLLVGKSDVGSSGLEGGVNLTGDGGVHKKLLQEGVGESVIPGCRVTVHYTGYLDNGLEFDSTRKREEPFRFVVNKGQVIRGWDIALLSMKEGETAKIRCSPSYAYGEKGVPPVIPPNAFLTFEIQLVKVERLLNTPSSVKDSDSIDASAVVDSKPKDEQKPERFYFISPFASQTGEQAPWWLNPLITFSVIFILIGIAFTIVVQSGALHTSYLKNN